MTYGTDWERRGEVGAGISGPLAAKNRKRTTDMTNDYDLSGLKSTLMTTKCERITRGSEAPTLLGRARRDAGSMLQTPRLK